MGRVLHGSATTTHAIRAAIQRSQASAAELSRTYGFYPRMFLEAVFWIARTGALWCDLPPGFGNWNTIYRRFQDWARVGVFEIIFNALSDDPEMEMAWWMQQSSRSIARHRALKGDTAPSYR